MYIENYKISLKEIKDLNKWEDIQCSWTRTVNMVTGESENNREITSIPPVCPGIVLCPGRRERNPFASVLFNEDF